MLRSDGQGQLEQRGFVALVRAVMVGVVAATVGGALLSPSHHLCEWQVGGEAGEGMWMCPDGIA